MLWDTICVILYVLRYMCYLTLYVLQDTIVTVHVLRYIYVTICVTGNICVAAHYMCYDICVTVYVLRYMCYATTCVTGDYMCYGTLYVLRQLTGQYM